MRGSSRYDTAKLQGRLWSPEVLRAKGVLAAWYDASEIGSISVSTGVATWRDRAGLRDATQGTGANQPAFVVNGWQPGTVARPSVLPDGSNDALTFSDITYDGSTGWAVFAATEITKTAEAKCLVGGPAAGAMTFGHGSNNDVFIIRTQQAVLLDGTDNRVPTGYHVYGCEVATNLCRVWTNGVSQENATNPAFTQPINRLFVEVNNDKRFVNDVGEIIICSSTLPTWEAQAVQGYLAWKWGTVDRLPALHHYKRSPPLIGGAMRFRRPGVAGALPISGTASINEAGDTLAATGDLGAPASVIARRLGAEDIRRLERDREEFEARQREWDADLRRIIDEAFDGKPEPEKVTKRERKETARKLRVEIGRDLSLRKVEALIHRYLDEVGEKRRLEQRWQANFEAQRAALLADDEAAIIAILMAA
jgi:hypothetical protein